MKKTKTSYLLRGTPSILLVLGAGFVMASSKDIRAALGMGVAVLLSMLLCSFFAIRFSTVFYILICGAVGVCVYFLRAMRVRKEESK